jgi:rare lipoprotein A (peptidoglycan hydrolase)
MKPLKLHLILAAVALGSVPALAEDFAGRWQLRSPGATIEPSQYGVASLFWEDSYLATGERFHPNETDPAKWVCATPDMPLNTMLVVQRGDKTITCRAADRGPAKHLKRVIDLPPVAAQALGITRETGLGKVTIRRLN